LIFSSFAQKYRFIKQNIGNYTFSNFLDNQYNYLNRNPIDHLAIYDFNKHIKIWESAFDTKATILFFEDFVHDKNIFYTKLTEILPATNKEIETFIGQVHYRKRKKNKDYIEIKFNELSYFGKTIAWFFPNKKFKRILEKRYYMRYSIFLGIEKKVFFSQKKDRLLMMTNKEKRKIEIMFNNSNKLFAKEREIPIEKMLNYGFIIKE